MELLRAGDEGFEAACVDGVFNARRPVHRPAAVVRARGDGDVVDAVRFAAAEGLRVAVRSGGHSWAAWSLREDSVLIDLGGLRDLELGEDGVAHVRPAVRGGLELAPYLSARGRGFPGGHCSSVGLGGFLLQGGQGWNSRAWGWGCENVLGVDVVTADGELVRADAEHDADLLWAARGAGPGFPGVVTRFHLQTHPLPAAMHHDTWTFRLEDGAELLSWLHGLLPELDVTVEPVVAATRLPDVPLFPGTPRPAGPVLLLHTTAMGADDATVLDRLAPFGAGPLAGRALGHVQGPTDIAAENAAQEAQNPEGHRYAADCTWTDASAEELAPHLLRLWSELPTEHSFSIWYGWAPTRPLPDMAFSVEADVYLATYAIWTDPGDDEAMRDWVHGRTGEIAAGLGAGVYLGDTDFTRRRDRFLAASHLSRLEDIRAVRDPDGRFCSYLTDDRK